MDLRPFTDADIPLLTGWMGTATAVETMTWAGSCFKAPLDEVQLKSFLKKLEDAGTARFYVIETALEGSIEEESGQPLRIPVGIISLGRIDRVNNSARVGFVLIGEKAFRGKGLGGLAVAEVLRIGFDEEQLHKITLGVFDYNIPALRCYTGLGFQREGMLRDQVQLDGTYYNLIEMSILEHEWRKGESVPAHYRETGRLILRTFTEADVPLALGFYRDNHDFFAPWSPVRGVGDVGEDFLTPEAQRNYIQQSLDMERTGSGLRLWLIRKKAASASRETVVGNISLSQIVRGPFQSAFLGYQLDHRFTGKGMAQEAVRELLKIGFNEMGLHRIEANIMPANTPSRTLARRLGFREEGYARGYLAIAGKWEDHIHYVMLAEEYRERYSGTNGRESSRLCR